MNDINYINDSSFTFSDFRNMINFIKAQPGELTTREYIQKRQRETPGMDLFDTLTDLMLSGADWDCDKNETKTDLY